MTPGEPPRLLSWTADDRGIRHGKAGGVTLFTIGYHQGSYRLSTRLPGFPATKHWNGTVPELEKTAERVLRGWITQVTSTPPQPQPPAASPEAAQPRLSAALRAVTDAGTMTKKQLGMQLGVTDARAQRLLRELEQQGRVRQTAPGKYPLRWEAAAPPGRHEPPDAGP